MYRTLGVLKQTSHVLSSVGHALSGDSDEAAVVLGVLTGAAIGTALGIAEKHRQASAQQSDTPHNDSAQPTAEPRQDTASQQIEQSM